MPQNVKNMIIAPQGNAGTLTQPEPEPQAIMTTPPVAVTEHTKHILDPADTLSLLFLKTGAQGDFIRPRSSGSRLWR
ncbi:hypothetical protein, partial [Salmonella enterica]|uniref:hypothetical protein n=1 Tax=Salmonella enterica TaxID=28901 RepID=UPI001594BD05